MPENEIDNNRVGIMVNGIEQIQDNRTGSYSPESEECRRPYARVVVNNTVSSGLAGAFFNGVNQPTVWLLYRKVTGIDGSIEITLSQVNTS